MKKTNLEINYPCFWEYKIIIEQGIDEKKLIEKCIGDRKYKLSFSRLSQNSKYISYDLSVFVSGQNERLELFTILKKECKFVL